MTPRDQSSRQDIPYLIGGMIAAVLCLLWGVLWSAAWVGNHFSLPAINPLIFLSNVWQAGLHVNRWDPPAHPSIILVGLTCIAELSLVALTIWGIIRYLSPRWQLRHYGTASWATWADLKSFRSRKVSVPRFCLGRIGRDFLVSGPQDNIVVFGPARSGKTSGLVIPNDLTWHGASIRTDQKGERQRLTGHRLPGPSFTFAPLEPDRSTVNINPAIWAQTRANAVQLSRQFFQSMAGPSGLNHWQGRAADLLAGLLLSGWGLVPQDDPPTANEDPEEDTSSWQPDFRWILKTLNAGPDAIQELMDTTHNLAGQELLGAWLAIPDRERGSIASTLQDGLTLWNDDRVYLATATHTLPDPAEFLSSSATLWLSSPPTESARLRPLYSLVLWYLLDAAQKHALAAPNGRLSGSDLALLLDEAGNFAKIPDLASWLSYGPGLGIRFLLIFHDRAQIEALYGPEATRTIWNNSHVKILLPGQSDPATLQDFTKAIGKTTERMPGAPWDLPRWDGPTTARDLMSADELRRLATGQLVAILGSRQPVICQQARYFRIPALRRLVDQGYGNDSLNFGP